MLRTREVRETVGHHQTHSLPRPSLSVAQQRAGRPEPPLGIVQVMLAQALLVGVVNLEQLDVPVRDATRPASLMELLRPNLQPL